MSRRIPISTTSQSNNNQSQRSNQQQQQQNQQQNQQGTRGGGQQQPKNWASSSLDIVFSFSRSQAFFGSNLPSSPSFVARYKRPQEFIDSEEENNNRNQNGGGDGNGEGEESSNNNLNRDGSRTTDRTNSEDRESESISATTDESWSEEEEDLDGENDEEEEDHSNEILQNWERNEVLPRNAVGLQHNLNSNLSNAGPSSSNNRRNRVLRSQDSSDGGYNNSSVVPTPSLEGFDYSLPVSNRPLKNKDREIQSSTSSTPLVQSPPNERTHLLVPKSSSNSFTPPTSFQPLIPSSSSKTPYSYSNSNPNHLKSNLHPTSNTNNRRFSVLSREDWSNAIEESRGKSTFGQTLFNAINILIGVGILAVPMAFGDAGWLFGSFLLIFCALITCYTAKILARIMAIDNSLETYSDVLVKAFGSNARTLIHSMFALELGAFGIALIVLFSDSMSTLFPQFNETTFKLLSFLIILPTTFLPLRFLSLTSLIGILSCLTLLIVLILDGLGKESSPGSLREIMPTSFEPNWLRLPLSLGLFMSGFSGHAVIPSLIRDMKDPKQFDSMINLAYIIAFSITLLMGVVGYCMFGENVSSEITRDMLLTKGYPDVLNKVAMWMIAINPVVKYALISRALSSTIEHLLGIHSSNSVSSPTNNISQLTPINQSPTLSNTINASNLSINSNQHLALESNRSNDLFLDNDGTSSMVHSEDSSCSVSPLNPFVPPNRQHSSNKYHHLNNQNKLESNSTRLLQNSTKTKTLIHSLISPFLLGLIILLAILIPDFGRVLSFLGASSAFLICCIGPLVALLILGKGEEYYVDGRGDVVSQLRASGNVGGGEENLHNFRGRRMFRKGSNSNNINSNSNSGNKLIVGEEEEFIWIVSKFERSINWILLIISTIFCLVGTVWTFLPFDIGE